MRGQQSAPGRPRSLASQSHRRSADPSPLVTWSLLAGLLLLATLLRVYRLAGQSLWADEGNSVALATRSIARIAQDAAADIHPPLYYWFLHHWVNLFGTSEAAVRGFSVLCGVLLVWLIYLIGRRLYGVRTGLAAAAIASISPFQVYYSQEARMYMLMALLGAIAVYAFVRYVLDESAALARLAVGDPAGLRLPLGTALLYVAATTGGFYTHYAFPVLPLTINLLYLIWLVRSRHRGATSLRFLRWIVLQAAVIIAFWPWLPTAVQRVTSWPTSSRTYNLNQALGVTLQWLAFGPAGANRLDPGWSAVFGLLLTLGLWPWRRLRVHWLSWGIPLAWLLAPIALMLTFDLYQEAYLKFLLLSSPAFCLLAGRGIITPWEAFGPGEARHLGWLRPLWPVAGLMAVVAASAMALNHYYFDPAAARDDYRSIAAYIAAVARPDDAILLNAPGQQEVFTYYYHGDLPVYPLPRTRPPDREATLAELEQLAQRHGRLFAVFWATEQSDPEGIIERWLAEHAFKALDLWEGNVRFVVYALPGRADAQALQETLNALFGDHIQLLSMSRWPEEPTAGDILDVSLRWSTDAPLDTRYKVTLQLLDDRDQVIAQHDSEPAGDLRPTVDWRPGETVLDRHGLLIPFGTPPGKYRLVVALYRPNTGERLPVAGMDNLQLAEMQVQRSPISPPLAAFAMQYARRFTFEEISLLGHDRYKRGFRRRPDEPLHPGDLLHFTFYWQARVKPTVAWRFSLRLLRGENEVASVSGPLVSDLYPTLSWRAGEIVRGEHDLPLPDYLEPGRYQLQLFLHTGNPENAADRVNLDSVTIRSKARE